MTFPQETNQPIPNCHNLPGVPSTSAEDLQAIQGPDMSTPDTIDMLSECEIRQTLAQVQDALIRAALDADEESRRLQGLNRELTETTGQDHLTGLQNRTRLEEAMGPIFDEAKDSGESLAALFIDADGFKSINDMCGHRVGDIVLRRLGRVLLRFCGDNAFRYGGEEFLCLLPGYDVEQAVALAEDIRRAVMVEEVNGGGCIVSVTVSVGVAVMDDEYRVEAVGDLITAADQALYAAKESGRNQVCVAEPVPVE